MDETWETRIEEFREWLASDATYSLAHEEPFKTLVALISLLKENEPRFLRQIGFPQQFKDLFEESLRWLDSALDSDGVLSSLADDQEDVDRLEELEHCLQKLQGIHADLGDGVDIIAERISEEAAWRKAEIRRRDEENTSDLDFTSPAQPDRDFDIERLFEDL